ncbi:oxidoreductase [Haloparvum sedimenti]|uniref:oxidoreductase n=1 Tax=Haloparvum sedimenti TaxID=1678448 RepID=UPI00071E864B|nr:oxidoreductase [Haloparvum sedimenti]
MFGSGWNETDVPDLDGVTAVVTGANSGIGYEATRTLADHGATVVMGCRSVSRGADAVSSIRDATPSGTLDVRELDLADLDSVASFATVVNEAYDGLDLLVNNAGVMAIPYEETADGFEYQVGVNHVGHFALTGRLLEGLRAGAGVPGSAADARGPSRVVTVSSALHERGDTDFDAVEGGDGVANDYDRWTAYGRSKLANLFFAYELDRRLATAGASVRSFACHPGYADTNLQARGPEADGSRVKRLAMRAANALFAQPAAAGALPTVYAATAPDLSGGEFVGPGGLFGMRGAPEVTESNELSLDREAATELWERSEAWTGVAYDLPEAR